MKRNRNRWNTPPAYFDGYMGFLGHKCGFDLKPKKDMQFRVMCVELSGFPDGPVVTLLLEDDIHECFWEVKRMSFAMN
ncbi:hypothetical protein BJ122_11717 [Rhodopseudomonas faecalis]|uniref:Uncharacterized protein n=1 Tax=Rhodopseudomonas faecalis TaxID=99655 RepID=A0A318TAR3_9BRAD|nr:hypothetical protein BJ122_11717 [Rhodopseudomonas faecalis]